MTGALARRSPSFVRKDCGTLPLRSMGNSRRPRRAPMSFAVLVAMVVAAGAARAATIDWKGHTWQVTSGGMAGVCQGSPANVTVDGSGYLHLRISNTGGTWTAAELFTTDK